MVGVEAHQTFFLQTNRLLVQALQLGTVSLRGFFYYGGEICPTFDQAALGAEEAEPRSQAAC